MLLQANAPLLSVAPLHQISLEELDSTAYLVSELEGLDRTVKSGAYLWFGDVAIVRRFLERSYERLSIQSNGASLFSDSKISGKARKSAQAAAFWNIDPHLVVIRSNSTPVHVLTLHCSCQKTSSGSSKHGTTKIAGIKVSCRRCLDFI